MIIIFFDLSPSTYCITWITGMQLLSPDFGCDTLVVTWHYYDKVNSMQLNKGIGI